MIARLIVIMIYCILIQLYGSWQHGHALLENDVNRNAGGGESIEIGLELRADFAHLRHERLHSVIVAIPL